MSDKLEELILYVAHKSHDDPRFGATKLNKILFLADFLAFGYWGKSITGATYIHEKQGPVPQGVVIACRNLINQGRAEIEGRKYFGYTQKRLIPKSNADLTLFSPEEIHLVTQMLRDMAQGSATELSDLTHRLRPWLNTVQGKVIPYETVFTMVKTPVTLDDKAWAIQKVKELQAAGQLLQGI